MNILNLLTEKKYIVGIEISDSFICVTYFKKNGGKQEDKLTIVNKPIENGVISSGEVKDKDVLVKSLKEIWSEEKLEKGYAIISIPEDKIYSHIFSFPDNITESQLHEAVLLAVELQLPFKKDEIYFGYEKINNKKNSKQVLVSAIRKEIADVYIEALDEAKISTLAIESHLASFVRSIKKRDDNKSMFIKKVNKDSATIFAIKDGNYYFSRTIPAIIANEDEIKKTKIAIESELNGELSKIDEFDIPIKDEYNKYLNNQNEKVDVSTAISLGATMRGLMKPGTDYQISLLPMSTEETYKYQKTKIFITLIRNMIISISLFFILAFVFAYIFTYYISQKINHSLPVTPSYSVSKINENDALIKEINSISTVSQLFLSDTVNWSIFLNELEKRTINGITISNLNVPSVNEKINMVGVSKDRETLNKFKKNLSESEYLTGIELPITNLEQKKDIPFSISFKIKNPQMLYYK